MRLLLSDVSNGLQFKEFDKKIPPYAILSHRWGDDEVLYDDILAPGPKEGPRFDKILRCCKKARENKFEYVWIDTCCIDKKSSAELSESINSMYGWYKKSTICYAFLSDVKSRRNPEGEDSEFRNSVWFLRGWTLQELIAPKEVLFLTASWEEIGTKDKLAETIAEITKVECGVLCGDVPLSDVCVAKKMSWASGRETAKVEDRAYSLLGIFGVNMTTIYGEGWKSFIRLQQQIMRHSTDHTIFAWDRSHDEGAHPEIPEDLEDDQYALLAPSPDEFSDSSNLVGVSYSHFARVWGLDNAVPELRLTNIGIAMELPLIATANPKVFLAVLACRKRNMVAQRSMQYCTLAVALYQHSYNRFSRLDSCGLVNVDCLRDLGIKAVPKQLYADDEYSDDDSSDSESDDDSSSDDDYEGSDDENGSGSEEDGSDSEDGGSGSEDGSGSEGNSDEASDDEDKPASESGSEGEESASSDGDEAEEDAKPSAQESRSRKRKEARKKIELVLNAPTMKLLREQYGYVFNYHDSDFGDAETNMHNLRKKKKSSKESLDLDEELDLIIASAKKRHDLTLCFSGTDSESPLALAVEISNDSYPGVWDTEMELDWDEHSGQTTPGVRHQSRILKDEMIEVMFTQIGTTLHQTTYLMEIQIHKQDSAGGVFRIRDPSPQRTDRKSKATRRSAENKQSSSVRRRKDEFEEAVAELEKLKLHSSDDRVRWVPTCMGILPSNAYPGDNGRYIARAYSQDSIEPGVLHEGDLAVEFLPYNERYNQHEYEFEVLTGPSYKFRWVKVKGPLTTRALEGVEAVPAGNDENGATLYIARGLGFRSNPPDSIIALGDRWGLYGMVRIGELPNITYVFPTDTSAVKARTAGLKTVKIRNKENITKKELRRDARHPKVYEILVLAEQ